MEELIGVINKDAYVEVSDGRIFSLPIRGIDKEGYREVSINATLVGGNGTFSRQSIKPYIGMKVSFVTNNGKDGFNFDIIT